ncbi:uncharacterized protein LOC114294224 [Camellia sinensis]|uniref:uncharacterized protein LOC114294224 n=1 Tax=Camellia sinensis TaxID=4442 RepID=UPI001035580E|nr:uncharacterized protein LOC114294224 [Camellia sinensis]
MGLLEDDEEWIQCLKEAAVIKIGYQLRRLFSIILTQCSNEAQHADPQITIDCLNNGQRNTYNTITSSVFQNKGTVFFLNGGAGTGKTFLYNTIALKCRSLGHIVVTAASSGIASLLLVGGRTTHSTFSILLDVLENSLCGFSKQSLQAELFRKTRLIIWDEVLMQHRHYVEAVDRTLMDICDSEKPFGGVTVVLGGDFRQILPVIPKGVREQIDWTEKSMELKRRNTTTLLRWGSNKIVVHIPHWGYIKVDTKAFWKVMRRKFGQTHI